MDPSLRQVPAMHEFPIVESLVQSLVNQAERKGTEEILFTIHHLADAETHGDHYNPH
jgi:hypothetical protein